MRNTRIGVAALFGIFFWLATPPVRAAAISIERAELRLSNDFYVLDAKIHYKLSKEARRALDHGIALDIVLEIEITRERRYLWDARVAGVRQGYRLEHHALSGQYVVVNQITGERRNSPTLADATRTLGQVSDVPIIEARVLQPGQSYPVHMNARLDIESLPPLLRPLAYLSSRWRLKSPTYRWVLQP